MSRLFDLAHQYGPIDAKERTSLQQQFVFLAENLNAFLGLWRQLDFARAGLRLDGSAELAGLFEGRSFATFHELVARYDEVVALHATLRDDPAREAERRAVADVLQGLAQLAASASSLAILPPTGAAAEEAEWLTPADLLRTRDGGRPPRAGTPGGTRDARARGPRDRRRPRLRTRAGRSRGGPAGAVRGAVASTSGSSWSSPTIASGPLTWSLAAFLLTFLVAALSWLRPAGRLLYRVTWCGATLGSALLVAAIVMRCLIRGRPPVSTLYETVLFVAAVGVLLALVVEWINRQRVALSAGVFLGVVGLFLANGYEVLDKRDTMPSLVAVLDTNFWLATHVTAITIGYSAGMFAALLANVYLLGKVLGLRRGDRRFYSGLGRMVYGVLAFALIFSLVGTVLGGIWANDSWGRFWGLGSEGERRAPDRDLAGGDPARAPRRLPCASTASAWRPPSAGRSSRSRGGA